MKTGYMLQHREKEIKRDGDRNTRKERTEGQREAETGNAGVTLRSGFYRHP